LVEPTFEQQWPHRVELACCITDYTDAFSWLWAQILKNNLESRKVFTTFGQRSVGFSDEHRQLAMHFKLRFG